MRPLRIRFVPRDGHAVDLQFLDKAIGNLLPCLKVCERVEGHGALRLQYRLRSISLGSLMIELEPIPIKGDPKLAERAVARFSRTIEALEFEQPLPADFTSDEVDHYRKLAEFAARRLTELAIDGVRMTSKALASLEHHFRRKVSIGSLRGRLESVNIHGRWIFRLYLFGGRSVECLFPKEMLTQVGQALGEEVIAWGRLFYFGSAIVPFRMELFRLEILQRPERVKTLSEMCGILTDIIRQEFRDKPSEQIIREIRDTDVQ